MFLFSIPPTFQFSVSDPTAAEVQRRRDLAQDRQVRALPALRAGPQGPLRRVLAAPRPCLARLILIILAASRDSAGASRARKPRRRGRALLGWQPRGHILCFSTFF